MEEPTEVATAVTFNHEKGKFLILQRSEERDIHPGKWDFPSGEVEEEEPKNAALRELNEETDLKGTVLRSGDSFHVETSDGEFQVHPFLVKASGKVELSKEHSDFEWIDTEELEEFDTVKGLKKDLRKVGALE